ncbi:MAG: MFS transporter [Promethearchaeota archaeon]
MKKSENYSDIVPLKQKLVYGFSAFPYTFYGAVMALIQSFFYGWMGLQNFWIVIAQIIYSLWNVINDPIFGNKISNTRYYDKRKRKNQRYMPYIKYGAPFLSLFFAITFFPPGSWRGGQGTIQFWLFAWYLCFQLAYDTFFTIVVGSQIALLPQLTLNQREREKIQGISTIFYLPASLMGFFIPTALLADPTTESVMIFQIIVIILAFFGIFPYFLLYRYIPEHQEHIPEKREGLWKSLKLASKNQSFLIYVIYDGITVFILNLLITTLPFYITWVLAPIEGFNILLFLIGPIICFIISVKMTFYLSKKYSTKASLSYYFGISIIGYFFTFFAGILGNWVLISMGFSIIMLGFAGDFIQHEPMRSDTIDYDFWKISGERREGLYTGIGALFSKPMISVALITPTTLMTLFGLISVGGNLVATQGMAMASLSLNIALGLIPGLVSLIGFIIWVKFYPLTKDIVIQMKKELHIIHEQRRKGIK